MKDQVNQSQELAGDTARSLRPAEADGVSGLETHECRECGQQCDCVTDFCCHPDTAECGVSQNFKAER
jgi:hypothetical protein